VLSSGSVWAGIHRSGGLPQDSPTDALEQMPGELGAHISRSDSGAPISSGAVVADSAGATRALDSTLCVDGVLSMTSGDSTPHATRTRSGARHLMSLFMTSFRQSLVVQRASQ